MIKIAIFGRGHPIIHALSLADLPRRHRETSKGMVLICSAHPPLAMAIGADGMKTGHLARSGFGLVGSAVQNGRRLILVLNGARTDDGARDGRSVDRRSRCAVGAPGTLCSEATSDLILSRSRASASESKEAARKRAEAGSGAAF